MVLTKEYRVCMPLTVKEVNGYSKYACTDIKIMIFLFVVFSSAQYQIGQLYMIARHSLEQSEGGEGVEVIENCPCDDSTYGKGQYTEKRIHLSR